MLTCMGADVDAIRSTGLRTGQMKSRSIGRRLGVVVLILTVAGPAGPLPAADAALPQTVTRAQFEAWFKEISNWGR